MEQGLYLYCLACLSRLPDRPLEGLGLDGAGPLQVTGFRDLAAVWSPVRLRDFCGPEAAGRLQDLNWIGPRAIRHQEVVAGVMRHSPVLPARFGTIFSSVANLENVLQQRHDAINRLLTRLVDREEWAVHGWLDRPAAKEWLFSRQLAREAAFFQGLTPGKRYFEEQRRRGACDRTLCRWLEEVRRELASHLLELAEAREGRLSRQASGDREMVCSWAILLPVSAVKAFQAWLQDVNRRYADRGLSLSCTGPWPPYSFCPTLGAPESEA